MKKPNKRDCEALRNLVEEARMGTADWFAEMLEKHGFLFIERVKGKTVARLFGVTPGAVSRWYSRDGMERNPDGTYNLADVFRFHLERMNEKIAQRGDPSKPPTDPLKRKLWAIAEKKLDELTASRRELIPREEFEEMVHQRIVAVSTALDRMPGPLADECAGRTVFEIRDRIKAACDAIRDAFGEEGEAVR
jgi:hypothetical protein